MFGRVVLALVSSPLYGLGVALAVLPMTIVGNLILATLGVALILLPLLLLIMAFLIQVAIYVQTARFAGDFSGLKRFGDQPDFFAAMGRGLILSFIGQIILGLGIAAVTAVFLEFRGGEALWWLDPDQLTKVMQRVLERPDQASNIFTFEGFDLEGFLFTLRITYMFFLTLIAIFMVPLACGVGWGFERTYNVGLILVRFLIAMPFLAGLAGIIGHFAVWGVNLGLGLISEELAAPVFFRFGLELALFAGMIFSFEALLLRSGVAQEDDEKIIQNAVHDAGQQDIRALRQSRMDR